MSALIDVDELVSLTWQRFWRHFTSEKLDCAPSVAAVLQYLKLCAASVVVDALRAREKENAVRHTLEVDARNVPASTEPELSTSDRMDLWRVATCHARDARERAVLLLRYRHGLRAAEVQAVRPDMFQSVGDVYRANRNVLERLRRSPAMRSWYDDNEVAS